jgi:hypothetical protein
MDHQFLAMTKQRVIVLVLADGKRDFTPTGEAKTVVGCEVCNMGLDEALELPNCMGMPLEEMLTLGQEEGPQADEEGTQEAGGCSSQSG